MTANPVDGVSIDPESYDILYKQLEVLFDARNVFEEKLVATIAAALIQLERARIAEVALLQVDKQSLATTDVVNEWFVEISMMWRDRRYIDPSVTPSKANPPQHKQSEWCKEKQIPYFIRPSLNRLDQMLHEQLMRDPDSLRALRRMLIELRMCLESNWPGFDEIHAQQLAWLLGESASRLVDPNCEARDNREQEGLFFPHKKAWATEIDLLIGVAIERQEGTRIQDSLQKLIDTKVEEFRNLEFALDWNARIIRAANMLLDDKTLAKIERYERHAFNKLERSIQMLALAKAMKPSSMMHTLVRKANGMNITY